MFLSILRSIDVNIYYCAFTLHLLLLFYGLVHDWYGESVKFTDIDYSVFIDAARAAYNGQSPYSRETYRYTPLIAYITCINFFFNLQIATKMLFCCINILAGKLLNTILEMMVFIKIDNKNSKEKQDNINMYILKNPIFRDILVSLWLLNPFSIVIAARGNADVIPSILVLLTLYYIMKAKVELFKRRKYLIYSGVFFGLAIHFKLYPIIYAVPFIFYINPYYLKMKCSIYKYIIKFPIELFTSLDYNQLLFGFTSFLVFSLLFGFFYYLYGWTFIYETYLYHFIRRDQRHNFSPFFYLFYLTMDPSNKPFNSDLLYKSISLISLTSQIVTVMFAGIILVNKQECCMAIFIQTVLFVAFNKVCTSQYFIWWFMLMPIAIFIYIFNNIPQQYNDKRSLDSYEIFWIIIETTIPISISLILWLFAKLTWLYFAYKLEMLGNSCFLSIFHSSLFFLLTNTDALFY
ncbi:mannosyltransferase family protein [Cryptosporidium andersoni]|uniref:GPI mannosyltransferase 1 n=1 Tax=Cryptosporidium andersoni TaxID=117008 RepID=A0A1J4MMS2_9CRYT|nr:mannosyltransferase family protein [Cryptosporidium andersoni]